MAELHGVNLMLCVNSCPVQPNTCNDGLYAKAWQDCTEMTLKDGCLHVLV